MTTSLPDKVLKIMSKPELTTISTKEIESESVLAEHILKLLKNIHYGSLEITVHNGKVVQIEKHEKFRLNDLAD